MPATIRDVAQAAGVSVTTAHRALNGKGELAEDKRQRVLAVARQLNYVPSGVARALVSGRTNTIGMIVTDNSSPVYAGIVRGVEEVVNAAGFGLLLCNSDNSIERELVCLEMLRSKHVDGILLTPVQVDRRDISYLQEMGIPYVFLLRHFDDLDTDYVILDNERAGYLATCHLIDLGHTRIGHTGGPAYVSSAKARQAGYRRALEERGIPFDEGLIARGGFTVEGGYTASRELLSRPNRPTALFSANDLQAVGVMKTAHELKIKIPEELALVGGDNIELSEFFEVPLTTFSQRAREIGARGAETLLGRLHGTVTETRKIVLEPEFVVRRSSGCPR